MKYQKTILVAALMTAMGSLANAQEWENPSSYTDLNENKALNSYTQSTSLDLESWAYQSTKVSPNNSLGVASISGDSQTLTLGEGKQLWVYANGKNTEDPVRIYGLLASNKATVANNGTLYVKSEGNGWAGYTRGLLIDGSGSATNTGTIVADAAAAMATTNTAGKKTFTNSGKIYVSNGGYAIEGSTNANGTVSIENSGSIYVDDKSVGIRISDTNESTTGLTTTITNTGRIYGDGLAISVEQSAKQANVAINLGGDSHIEGTIKLDEAVNVSMAVYSLTNKESLQVIGEIDNLSVTSSDITINQVKGETLTVDNITVVDKTSDLTFRLNEVKENALTVNAQNAQGLDRVSYSFSGTVSDEIAAEENFDVSTLFNSINITGLGGDKTTPDEVSVEEGTWGNSLLVTDNGNGNYSTQVLSENSLLRSAKDLALTNALVWRSELTSLSDRMGTLRTHPESTGAWARYTGGNLEGNGVDFDFNSIEIGFDTPVTNTMTLGVSFGYTKGDSDLVSGSADTDSYKLGLYATYMHEAGSFLDAMLKVGRIDASYDLNNGVTESGDYMYTGVIAGIETGHRWTLNQFYVEPQIQLTYSYLQAETYSTAIRTVDFDSTKSLIGRIGFMTGMNFAQDKGSAYLKASYNHDFLGDMTGRFYSATHNISFSEELDQNWGEVSLGASYSMTDSLNGFVDVSRTFGGDIDQKWRVNLGARYQF